MNCVLFAKMDQVSSKENKTLKKYWKIVEKYWKSQGILSGKVGTPILLKYLLDKYRSQHRKFFQLTERFTENVRLTSVIIVEMEELTLKSKEPSYVW